MRGKGRIFGTPNEPVIDDTSGIFSLNEIALARIENKWKTSFKNGLSAGAATTPHYLRNTLGITTDGNYWIKTSEMSSAIYTYISFNLLDSKDWVLMMHLNQTSGTSGSLVGTDHIGSNAPWKGFALDDDETFYYSYFSTNQLYAERSDTTTSSGGNKSGYRIFLGRAGGHGFYNTSQTPCNWQIDNGMVGAGYDGSCGTYPVSLRMGFGTDSSPFINSSMTGQIKSWIWMDTSLPG